MDYEKESSFATQKASDGLSFVLQKNFFQLSVIRNQICTSVMFEFLKLSLNCFLK